MSARYTLNGIFLSGPTYKVGLMLALAGEPFNYKHVNLREGAHKSPEFLAKNRFGQVPCLVDESNGRHLSQSASILDYLADRTGKFGGATLEERIAAREWMFWEFDRLAPAVYRTRSAKLGFRQLDAATLSLYEGEAKAGFDFLNQSLAGRNWLVGEGATIADIDVYGVLRYASEGGFDLAVYPNLVAWMSRLEALPGFGHPSDILPSEDRVAA